MSDLNDGYMPVGAATGDLNGTYPAPIVEGINGAAVPPAAAVIGTNALRQVVDASNVGGDLSGALPNPTVVQVNGAAVPASASMLGSNAGRQLINLSSYSPMSARVAAGNFVTASLVLVDITGLSIALLVNAVYEFEVFLSVNSSSVAGLKTGINFSGAGATVEGQTCGGTSATAALCERLSALNTLLIGVFCTIVGDRGITIKGVIVVGANAGNLTAMVAKVTSGNATIYANSLIKARRIA